jgi:hypothetical protein
VLGLYAIQILYAHLLDCPLFTAFSAGILQIAQILATKKKDLIVWYSRDAPTPCLPSGITSDRKSTCAGSRKPAFVIVECRNFIHENLLKQILCEDVNRIILDDDGIIAGVDILSQIAYQTFEGADIREVESEGIPRHPVCSSHDHLHMS